MCIAPGPQMRVTDLVLRALQVFQYWLRQEKGNS